MLKCVLSVYFSLLHVIYNSIYILTVEIFHLLSVV